MWQVVVFYWASETGRLRRLCDTFLPRCFGVSGRRAQGVAPLRRRVALRSVGKFCIRVCLIRVPFSRVLGTLILRRQFGARRLGVTIKNFRGTFCTGNRRYFDTAFKVAKMRGNGAAAAFAVRPTSWLAVPLSARLKQSITREEHSQEDNPWPQFSLRQSPACALGCNRAV